MEPYANIMDTMMATSSALIPAASPTVIAVKMYSACAGRLSENRNLTAATIPARLKARGMLFWTIIAIPATITGRISIVWINDESTSRGSWVRM